MNATIGTSLVRLNYAVAAWCVLAAGDDFHRSLKAGFRPDEPRVPAGSPGGGRWTDGGGSGAFAGIGHNVDPIVTGGTQDHDKRHYSVDLRAEEAPAGIGHAIRDHVGKTDAELVESLKRKTFRGWLYDYVDGQEGTFDSIENANDLTNRVLRMNKGTVDEVASGNEDEAYLEERFGFATGREARRSEDHPDIAFRKTYSVGVVIRHDIRSKRGYYVFTSFPRNRGKDDGL
ncbi:MAG: RNase A-like domain-containing protein [Rhizobiaceae bacterium]